jgi:hypothetical protein
MTTAAALVATIRDTRKSGIVGSWLIRYVRFPPLAIFIPQSQATTHNVRFDE